MQRSILAVAFALVFGGSAAAQYQTVDSLDLAVGTNKFRGKDIRVVGAHCYYADVGDYRCAVGNLVVILAGTIEPEISRLWIEKNCGVVRKALASKDCAGAIKFTYDSMESDVVDGFQRRTLIYTPEIRYDLPYYRGP